MAEDISNPLLSLVKEQGLVDDLQYEEVAGEFKRSGKPVLQILQDFGVMDLDSILHVMAEHLGTQVVTLRDRELAPQLLQTIPPATARMYQCLPVGLSDSTLQIALADPLNPGRIDELGFIVKQTLQLVVVDPAQIQIALEKYYPEDNESVTDILRQLGADKDIAKEVSEVTASDDAAMME